MSNEYIVVARRYRPQSFGELIGQSHVATAIQNAISSNRVGHAYLFTGARGVGKTSAARIFAKALNCEESPGAESCNACELCQAISSGEDIDVLEIDGASNRGIDEIRQLRSNVGMRPSRARFKVYIIDEVHMLTKEAFNALLKTLEEPPDHVKFVFCTTDPEKIPITVLSRCQRFDFAPIAYQEIAARLSDIVRAENAEADPEALELLARRAAGSMRDSQSLLEQLLSFAGDKITVDTVHGMLGTARVGRLQAITSALIDQDAATALTELDAAISEGVDVGQLAEQLLGYFRDCMAAAVGCEATSLLHVGPGEYESAKACGESFGVATLLAAAQILDQSIARMRLSLQRRTLVEMALVRISHLEGLADLSNLIAQLEQGPTTTKSSKKKLGDPDAPEDSSRAADTRPAEPSGTDSPSGGSATQMEVIETTSDPTEAWKRAVDTLEGLEAECASQFERCELSGERLRISFTNKINADRCARSVTADSLRKAASQALGKQITLEFTVDTAHQTTPSPPKKNARQLVRESYEHPMVKRAVELFDGEVTRVLR